MKQATGLLLAPILVAVALGARCKTEDFPPDFPSTEPRLLTNTKGKNEDPSLLRGTDGKIYLAWFSDRNGNADIYWMHSTDGGTWSEPKAIIQGGGAGNFYPSLAQTKDSVFHLAWFRIDHKSHKFSVWYANSKDGKNWGEPQAITPRNEGYNWVPTIIAAKDGSLWIAWSSGKTGNKDVFVAQSKDGGASWGEPVQVTHHPFHDDLPNIEQKPDGTFIVVWPNHRPDRADYLSKSAEIYYATYQDGQKWSDPVAITKNDHTDTIPEVYANLDQSEYFVAWCAPTGTWELFWSALQAQPKRLLGSKPGGSLPPCR